MSKSSDTRSMIPSSVYEEIVQIKSSPETIVALLNEAESKYSSEQKKPHKNSKRVYPFWKTCEVCSTPYPCSNSAQAVRNKTCGRECAKKLLAGPRGVMPMEERKRMALVPCSVCGEQVWKPMAWLRRVKSPTCSRECNGKLRSVELVKHSRKGRAGWTDESMISFLSKMTGENNPAWKGGVTLVHRHGNYGCTKYVRCPPEFLPMARKDGYVMEHRLLVAQAMGRCLRRSEAVHHEDHNPTNNDLANLSLFESNQAHKLYEAHGSPAPIWCGLNRSTIAA